eukprot:407533-Rhodomonas_salina.4
MTGAERRAPAAHRSPTPAERSPARPGSACASLCAAPEKAGVWSVSIVEYAYASTTKSRVGTATHSPVQQNLASL